MNKNIVVNNIMSTKETTVIGWDDIRYDFA